MPALLLACACVAGAVLGTKPLLGNADPLAVTFVQIAASTAVMFAAGVAHRRLPHPVRDVRLALPGLLQPGLAYILAFSGLALIPASLEGLLTAFESAMVALLAWMLLGERPGRATRLAIGAGTIGVAMMSGAGLGNGMTSAIGIALVLAGVACASLDTVAARHLAPGAHPLTMTIAGHFAALCVSGALLLLWSRPVDWHWLADARLVWGAIVTGVLVHGIATLLFNFALAHVTAATTAAILPVISLLTAAGGTVVLGERLGAVEMLGGAIIIASSLIAALMPGKRSATLPTAA